MYQNYNTIKPTESQDLLTSDTIENFIKHRAYRDSYEPLITPTLNERQQKAWADCASEIWVRPDGTVASTVSCHNRFCCICSWRDARRKYAYTMRSMEQLQPLNLVYAFLTVTVRNVKAGDLRSELDNLMTAINRMQSTNTWRRRVLGYIRSLEITYNNDTSSPNYDTYHPHIHYIIALPSDYYQSSFFLSAAEWRQLWQRSARLDYTAQVKIEAIQGSDMKAAVCEVSKYALKLSSVIETGDAAPTQTIAAAVKGRRLVAYGGVYKDIQRQLKASDRAERELNREVSGYVYKLIDGEYRLLSPIEQTKARAYSKRTLEAMQSLTDAYSRHYSKAELESLAVSLIDSPPTDKNPINTYTHELREKAARSAYNGKKAG